MSQSSKNQPSSVSTIILIVVAFIGVVIVFLVGRRMIGISQQSQLASRSGGAYSEEYVGPSLRESDLDGEAIAQIVGQNFDLTNQEVISKVVTDAWVGLIYGSTLNPNDEKTVVLLKQIADGQLEEMYRGNEPPQCSWARENQVPPKLMGSCVDFTGQIVPYNPDGGTASAGAVVVE